MKTEDNISLVEIFSGSPWEAELIKGLLESNEIEAVIKDGIMGTLAPYLSSEVSVLVVENNYEAAMQVIKSRNEEKAN